jgi:acylphosphatase
MGEDARSGGTRARAHPDKPRPMNEARRGLRCYISGRVQGVFFRASTQEKAQQLGLTGYARNLPDGRVEVYAYGLQSQLDALEAWLWQGPPGADVSTVECEPVAMQPFDTFETR